MTRTALAVGLAIGTAIAATSASFAHHSNVAFDGSRIDTVQGTVEKWAWVNPHTWLYLMVKEKDGRTVRYALEGRSPGVLVRSGWSKSVFAPGDKVTADFNPARDGTKSGLLARVTLANGKALQ